MIGRDGKPTRALYECKYCGHRSETGVNFKPSPGFCARRPKVAGKMQPHVWVIIKKS